MVTAVTAPTLTFTRTIHAPAEQVYQSFTQRDWVTYWFCDEAHVRPAVSGHALFVWNTGYHAFCSFKALEPNQRVVLAWRGMGETHDSEIEVAINAQDGGTGVALTISGHNSEAEAVIAQEWETRLDNLVSALETGADQRITQRVIIGIFPTSFDEKDAARLGVPMTQGTRVGNVIPGLGAAAAGLQPDDVIVAMDGKDVTPDRSMSVLVANRKPGDKVEVTYYRGGEKRTAKMKLSGYPVPPIYDTLTSLANAIEQMYAEHDAELTAVFDGVSESEAGKKPAPEEWSAQQVVAHLILNERWLHSWLGGHLQGPEISGYTCNSPARIAGVLSNYPTTADLLAELRRGWAETLAIVRSMPASVAERKAYLWWMSFEVMGLRVHTEDHFDQMRKAIAAARAG